MNNQRSQFDLNGKFAISPREGVGQEKFDENRAPLGELGLLDNVKEQINTLPKST